MKTAPGSGGRARSTRPSTRGYRATGLRAAARRDLRVAPVQTAHHHRCCRHRRCRYPCHPFLGRPATPARAGDHLRWRRGLLLGRRVLLGLGHHDRRRHVGHIRHLCQLRGRQRLVQAGEHDPVATTVSSTAGMAGAVCLRRHPDERHHRALVLIQRVRRVLCVGVLGQRVRDGRRRLSAAECIAHLVPIRDDTGNAIVGRDARRRQHGQEVAVRAVGMGNRCQRNASSGGKGRRYS